MTVGLILGDIQFYGREVPDVINFGGKQMLAVHKNIGGYRTIDAMGPDPSIIRWAGHLLTGKGKDFPTQAADERARMMDALRQSGKQVQLAWPGFARQVVVSEFSAVYKDQWQIQYRIACVVVSDTSLSQQATTTDQAINSDVSSVQSQLPPSQAEITGAGGV